MRVLRQRTNGGQSDVGPGSHARPARAGAGPDALRQAAQAIQDKDLAANRCMGELGAALVARVAGY